MREKIFREYTSSVENRRAVEIHQQPPGRGVSNRTVRVAETDETQKLRRSSTNTTTATTTLTEIGYGQMAASGTDKTELFIHLCVSVSGRALTAATLPTLFRFHLKRTQSTYLNRFLTKYMCCIILCLILYFLFWWLTDRLYSNHALSNVSKDMMERHTVNESTGHRTAPPPYTEVCQ